MKNRTHTVRKVQFIGPQVFGRAIKPAGFDLFRRKLK